jgi:uncharacterized protein
LAICRETAALPGVYPALMPNNLARFSIHAEDVQRARKFYEDVFGWDFEPWGPPNFYLIETGREPISPVGGLLQERHETAPGIKMTGFECTVGVDNIDETMRKIEAAGGKLVMAKFQIPTVGSGAYYQDTEGNVFCVMQYEKQ